jgi:biofilm PGA synthesis N-glycosyltransferase PgaC
MIGVLSVAVLSMTILYSIFFQRRISAWSTMPECDRIQEQEAPAVSVIIAFRNEVQRLPLLLHALNLQEYPKAEFIFVNDHSSDKSEVLILQAKDSRVRLIELQEASGKKAAVEAGIKAAKGEIILTTDADCEMGSQWISKMILPFSNPEVLMVSGPVMFKQENSFFQRWMKLEFISLVASGGASMALNKPNMCNGANLAYRKSVFQARFLKSEVPSGEDIFLMLALHKEKKGSLKFNKHKQAMVSTFAPSNLKSFIQQRIRWASKASAYSSIRLKAEAFFIGTYHLLLISLLFMAIVYPWLWGFAVTLLLVKMLNDYLFFKKTLPFFDASHLLKRFLLSELLHLIYIPFFAVLGLIGTYEWKERRIKKK